MHKIAKHFDTGNLVLFDDIPANVAAAQRQGYRGQLVSSKGECGVSVDDLAVLL